MSRKQHLNVHHLFVLVLPCEWRLSHEVECEHFKIACLFLFDITPSLFTNVIKPSNTEAVMLLDTLLFHLI